MTIIQRKIISWFLFSISPRRIYFILNFYMNNLHHLLIYSIHILVVFFKHFCVCVCVFFFFEMEPKKWLRICSLCQDRQIVAPSNLIYGHMGAVMWMSSSSFQKQEARQDHLFGWENQSDNHRNYRKLIL
ncbi:hypothetical protein BDA96_09G166900 [Sorghum bicolor]|uniref:Uncharacterized protein n=1 Tax=Sorghum bicolor TaxID=4558 RepID=A0A921QAW5_SORBI|nr:hypothetical protein BDA96_09G166900 [Sorghum bicolor]